MNPSPEPPPPDLVPAPRRRRPRGWLVACWLLALFGLDTRLPPPVPRPAELDVEINSTVDSTVQVFFDVGRGFNERDSATAHVAPGPAPQTLAFPVPMGAVRAIRLDPLTVPGTVHLHSAAIRRTDDRLPLHPFDVREVTPLQQIARVTPKADDTEIVTLPDAADAAVTLPVFSPIEVRPKLWDRLVHFIGVDISATFLLLLAGGAAYWAWPFLRRGLAPVARPLGRPFAWVDRRFAAWAAVLDRPGILRVDRWALWFLAACALVFGAMAAAGLHGSSLDEYASTYPWSGRKARPLLGEAREIRSDEWAVQTPVFLNQVFRRQAMGTETSALGHQNAALLLSVPCRDFTQWFRPEFWPFHVLPIELAFPIYWQAKGFVLLTGVFALLLLLTRGDSRLAALGALWMFFSAHMQWAWSWQSMLPEMVGFFGWTICLTLYLTVGRHRWRLAAAAAGCAISALDFALCFYPPHQIPFVLFGALLVPVWIALHRAEVFRREWAGRRLLALAVCWGVVALVMLGFLLEARGAIATATSTVYPGKRVSSGGGVPLEFLLSQFLDFWKGEHRFPASQGNICESTGFLWLLPVTLFALGRRRPGPLRGGEAVLAVCWATAAVVAAWLVFPVPPGLGRWLLLDHVPPVRCLPGLGLVNIVGVIVYLSWPTPEAEPGDARPVFWRGAGWLAIFGGVMAALLLTNTVLKDFFQPTELLLGAGYAAVLAVCLLERRRAIFAAVLLLPLVCAFGLVNPVDRGLAVVTRSQFFKTVRSNPQLRDGSWLVYSHDFTITGFVVASGVDVFNSFKVLPDLQAMAAFDPEGRALRSYNQSGHLIAHPLPEGQPPRFENADVGLLVLSVSPLDPVLRRVGIRYLVFDQPPDPALAARLSRVAPEVPALWIYALP